MGGRMKISVLELDLAALRSAVESLGQPAYRAGQVADWVYGKAVGAPAKMTNLPAALQEHLEVLTSRVVGRADSADGTFKLLVELADGLRVETVLIPQGQRLTACLSTQVGCAMSCAFCASGLGGLSRDLTGGEILQELLHLRQAAGSRRAGSGPAGRVTHVVFMGMGEPLANYGATLHALRAIVDPQRFGISARRVTVSTVGLPAQMRRLAREGLPITLAVSLHAPNDALRRQLVPLAAKVGMEDVLRAAEEFRLSRNRQVTLEYVLLEGVNDTNVCAAGLARIAKRLRCSVNLIGYNPVDTLPYRRIAEPAVRAFAARLRRVGVSVQVRRSRGADARAACGQLSGRAAPGGR
jgi:23S rRNA (adenine2503-C2)-methyltransferase